MQVSLVRWEEKIWAGCSTNGDQLHVHFKRFNRFAPCADSRPLERAYT